MSNITPQAILRNKKHFEEYAENYGFEFIETHIKEPTWERIITIKAELTQSPKGLRDLLHFSYKLDSPDAKHYLLWFVKNEKEELVNSVKLLNSRFCNDFGIYLVKAFLSGGGIDFEILSKPKSAKK
jgi:hypothetical protein